MGIKLQKQKLKELARRLEILRPWGCLSQGLSVFNFRELAAGRISYKPHVRQVYNIPYDRVERNKPLFNYYIDDRNVGTPLTEDDSVDWAKIKELINKLI